MFFFRPESLTRIIIFLLFLCNFSLNTSGLPCDCLEDRVLILRNPPMEGYDVLLLQERLQEKGFYDGPFDGVYDLETARAVALFQQAYRLEVDGVVDVFTWDTLGEGVITANTGKKKKGPQGEISIVINTYSRTLTIFSDGKPFRTYPVAIGKPDTRSPVGEWAVISKSKDWGGGFGTRWLGLNVPWGIYGIHGTNKPWSIGRASSHGCFRMYNRDIEELYEWVPLKTRVKVIGERLPVQVKTPLRPGQMGLSVMQLQDNLISRGFGYIYRDARYGADTSMAVQELEAQFGLRQDGTADWNVLYLLDLVSGE
ncbi:MAG: L,D-transpeptidase family protein [Halanaerobiaceae bacterium]|nr:L,D-transpeptidase family protein [Halanaerobiaceae bacterium]